MVLTKGIAPTLIVAALGLGIALFYLSRLPNFTHDNDAFYNFGTGFSVDSQEPFLQRFQAMANSLCKADSPHCHYYYQLLNSNLTFNYPIVALFGRSLMA